MATEAAFAEHVRDQAEGAGTVTIRKMFGEYALYCDGKVVALLCDNQLFLKPLPEALALIAEPVMGAPYPGARPHALLVDEIDDAELLARLLRVVAEALPLPKPKTSKPKTSKPKAPKSRVPRKPRKTD